MISLFAALCSALIPVPSRPTGIKYGPSYAPINIEVFVDITCPDCATEYSTVKKVLEAYPTQVNVVYHFFELPSHTWSYLLTRSIFACLMESEEYAKKMVDGLLGDFDQKDFYPSKLAEEGEARVLERAKQYAVTQTGIDEGIFEANYDDLNVISLTRIEFKYSLIRNLKGTPTVYINGVETSLNEESTLQDWKDLINSLLN